MIPTKTLFILVSLLVSQVGVRMLAAEEGATWPQWRGPGRDGSVMDSPWPDSLDAVHLLQRWRIELAPSYSGPVVSKDKVFVTYTRNEQYEGVRALDRVSGEQLWQAEWEDTMQVAELGTSMGSWIRATPTLDGDSLYVAGMPDLLVCLDPDTGDVRWRVDFRARYGTPLPELGFVSSPLVVDDGVYVQAADSFVKVDKRTGESLWRSLEREDKGQGAYSSPGLGVVHGRSQLLVADIDAIAGVEPSTGTVLWRLVLDSYDQGCILTPIVHHGGVFTSTRASQTGHYPLVCEDDLFSITDGWKNKLVAYMSAPVVVGDFAYLHLKNERFACVDLRDGNVNWISNRPFGRYCSIVWCQNRILALNNEGQLF